MKFNEHELLTHAGKVAAEVAHKLAEERYDSFDSQRKKIEARMADEEDMQVLEELEKVLFENDKEK